MARLRIVLRDGGSELQPQGYINVVAKLIEDTAGYNSFVHPTGGADRADVLRDAVNLAGHNDFVVQQMRRDGTVEEISSQNCNVKTEEDVANPGGGGRSRVTVPMPISPINHDAGSLIPDF